MMKLIYRFNNRWSARYLFAFAYAEKIRRGIEPDIRTVSRKDLEVVA